MTLKTPRRRISPRTRKRYRAIKGFFKRAIGGSSQPDIVINSSTDNVTDLKHKIVGLEQQLSEVSRTCHEFIYLDGSRRASQAHISTELAEQPRDDSTGREPRQTETKTLFKKSENYYINRKGSSCRSNHNKELHDGVQHDKMIEYDKKNRKEDPRAKHFDMKTNLRKLKTHSAFDCVGSTYSTTSFRSLDLKEGGHHSHPGYSGGRPDRRLYKMEHTLHCPREDIHKEQHRVVTRKYDDRVDRTTKHSKNRKFKRDGNELDEEFIADIIKRQYKPVQMFGRKESDISQISEPLCRDREFTMNDTIQEDNELCNCCYGGRHSPKHHRHSDNSDLRSVCDARLYSSKRNPRFYKYRRAHADAYNDSELYDLIPVKEKTSPKSRRKFARDNLEHYHDYREVPPSPRTHRPRLNLKSQQYTESEDQTDFVRYHNRRMSPKRQNKYDGRMETFENDYPLQMLHSKKNKHQHKLPIKPEEVHQEMGTTSSLQYTPNFDADQNNITIDTSLNNTQDTGSNSDKTDRALFEIKDILQSFLQEIKKESSSSDKSDVSTKVTVTENCMSNPSPHGNAGVMPNSGHSFNYSTPHCSSAPAPYIMPPYPNTCCYPVMPMYSMNCMQSGFVMPSQSFTCGCSKTDESTNKNKANNTTGNETIATETDELIKEIYKFVAQSPTFTRKQDTNVITDTALNSADRPSDTFENRVFTTRSAGGSRKFSRHDATVETAAVKCYSKSCEAIGSRIISEAYYSETNPTYSDSAIENISLEATATTSSTTEESTERSEKHRKSSNTKFGKVLRSIGLFKKKKTDAIEEESESESTIDVIIKKPRSPYQQEVTNYMMSKEVYDRPPPVPQEYRQPAHYPHEYRPPYNPVMQNYPPPPNEPYYDPRMHQVHQQGPQKGGGPQYDPGYPSAPPFANYENYNQPQVPLCLKEIEVKSMATQSERKMSFFRKIKEKMQPSDQRISNGPRTFATQTKTEKPGLWKSLQAKALEGKNEPMSFSFQQQQKLRSTDNNMRNAMLKKIFYKRNPFSPRNLIVRTLMGRDKSSFGDPPTMYRPSMFI